MTASDHHLSTVDRDNALFSALPYESYPYAASQPDTLYTLAALFGQSAPPVEKARVLELGCASGGNIVPLALRYPQGTYLGVDLVARHIETGQARIAALGLENIALRQADLLALDLEGETFDYVICHGVYSWVDAETQTAILEICKRALAPGGLAYVSYNVLPGWQQRSVIRDIFAFSDTSDGNAPDRVARGRWLLEQLAKASDQGTPYGQLLRREAQMLSAQNDSYLMSEFLVGENRPCYFHEFAARARAAGLSYFAEAQMSDNLLALTHPQMDQIVQALAGPDPVQYEQYLDFLKGRQFRQTVLMHDDEAPRGPRKLVPARLAKLHVASRLRRAAADEAEDGGVKLEDPEGRSITTNDPAVIGLFDHLGRIAPGSLSWTEALRVAREADSAGDDTQLAERVGQAILKLSLAGLSTLSAAPMRAGTAQSPRPGLWPLARRELAEGQGWLTGMLHTPVRLSPENAQIAGLFDGQRDMEGIAADIAARIADGRLTLEDSTAVAQSDPDAQARAIAQHMRAHLAASGLLDPDGPKTLA